MIRQVIRNLRFEHILQGNTLMKLYGSLAIAALSLAACGGSENATTPETISEAPAALSSTETRAEIRVVGSSTVYPFSIKVAQEYKNKTGVNVVVESTGSGGGHKLFCEGLGVNTPDVTNSSRRQKASEFETCANNGVDQIVEVKVGYDGIVIANALEAPAVELSLEQIYRAFAKEIPTTATDCTMIANPYNTWADIDPALPANTIEAFGPPPTSGTRDAFVEVAMEGGAKNIECLAALRSEDKKAFKTLAHTLREDGKWIDAGENDNSIVQTLTNTPTAFGIFGYSFLDQNADKVRGTSVDGAAPTFENIASGAYPISRSLFIYVKAGHADVVTGLQDFALEFTSEDAWGPGGYLEEIGLVPLSGEERSAYRAAVETLSGYSQ